MRALLPLMMLLLAACGSATASRSDVFSAPNPSPYDRGQGLAGGAILKGIVP
jgi:hypothetical protein